MGRAEDQRVGNSDEFKAERLKAMSPSAASTGSTLVDDMAEGLRAYRQAFANLNNNDDASQEESYRCALMKEHINFGRLLKRYDAGER